MCMNITRGESKKKWLCSAVTSRPLSRAADITGFTSSSNRTRSPMTISSVCECGVNAAHEVRPRNGCIAAAFHGDLDVRARKVDAIDILLRSVGALDASHLIDRVPLRFGNGGRKTGIVRSRSGLTPAEA